MTAYIAQWNYQSGYGGPWAKGEVLELEQALAERINVDSPGVLVEKAVAEAEEQGSRGAEVQGGEETEGDEAGERGLDASPKDRMVRGARAKR